MMVNREIFRSLPHEMLYLILSQLPTPVMVVNSWGDVVYSNQQAEQVLELSFGNKLRHDLNGFYHDQWNNRLLLSSDEDLEQDTYQLTIGQVQYLCFQKHLPPQVDSPALSVLSFQATDLEYDLHYDCNAPFQQIPEQGQFFSKSQQMKPLLATCKRCAPSDMTILFLGESGTGKTMLAEYVHKHSLRKEGPFIVLNCAAINGELLESELFGYVPHAFTNASAKGKIGLFELADGGTLLLDEIGDMPLDLQAKILTAVETQSILPIGGSDYKSINVRILAATNQDLKERVAQGTFREDLLWRLNVLEVSLPPLRERRDDIGFIADSLRCQYNERNGTDIRFTPELESFLTQYDWPGNVRQLKNTVEKMLFTTRETQIPISAASSLFQGQANPPSQSYTARVEARERRFIQSQYQRHPSTRRLANALDVSQSTATRLIQKYVKKTSLDVQEQSMMATHTLQENRQGRLTQPQLYQVLDAMPQRVCVVDHDLVCIAEKQHDSLPTSEDGLTVTASTSTAMYRAGYKMARIREASTVLEYITVSSKKRQVIIAPVCDTQGKSTLYTSVSLAQFDTQAVARQRQLLQCKDRLHVGNKDYAFFCHAPEMKLFLQDVDRAACQDLSVLLRGESGTGKSVFAQYIHQVSERSESPFVSINCATIPHNLIEAELFGYEKGAFTGANPQGKKGLFELANGGTLFLDEIGDMPLAAQAKFLDVIENKRFIPMGGNQVLHTDVRIICATNKNLQKLMTQKQFREDLYWRINIIELEVPSLRQRPEDIEAYAKLYLDQCTAKYGTKKVLSHEALTAFQMYTWPGNLRQLSNTVERGYILSEGDELLLESLPQEFHSTPLYKGSYTSLQRRWDEEIVAEAIQRHGTAQRAASELKVSSATVSRKRSS